MAGIIGTGDQYRRNAMSGLQRAASLEQARDAQNKQIAIQETNQKTSMSVAGGMAGAYAGAQMGAWGGPIGIFAGAAIGYLLSEVF